MNGARHEAGTAVDNAVTSTRVSGASETRLFRGKLTSVGLELSGDERHESRVNEVE
jgi:hypothetical protein